MLTILPLLGFADISQVQTDKISPKINLQSPDIHFEVMRGEMIHVNAHLQDNQELDSYRLIITKGGVSTDKYADSFSSYYKLDADGKAFPSISGFKTFELNFDVKVDENAIVGDYNFKFFLKDKAGNVLMIERFFNVCCH
jgi:hypothetical protein